MRLLFIDTPDLISDTNCIHNFCPFYLPLPPEINLLKYKNMISFRSTTALLIFIISIIRLLGQTHTMILTVTNDGTQFRTNEPIVINLHQIKHLSWNVACATVTNAGKGVPSQIDDIDGDSKADEVVFLTDIGPKETQTFKVILSATGQQIEYPSKVYAHMSIGSKATTDIAAFEALGTSNVFNSLYHHGACFESELVGYRIYSDHRQNIDVYGKHKHRLELAVTKFNTNAGHLAAGYGHDVLWIGQSIGCGTLREWHEGKVIEMLDVKRRGQRIIAYGPLRTVVEVTDKGWHDSLYLRTLYILYAGHRDVLVEVDANKPFPKDRMLCTGVQKIGKVPQGIMRQNGIVASWGYDWPDYGKKQLYSKQAVGLATYVPKQYMYKNIEDSLQYITVINTAHKKSFYYWFMACADMEEESPFHSESSWFKSLDLWRERLMNPLKVSIQNKQ